MQWAADHASGKILVTGAILGGLTSGSVPQIASPCGLILFREFAVSALRETAVVFAAAMVFIALVVIGFAYDWRKGVFRWR